MRFESAVLCSQGFACKAGQQSGCRLEYPPRHSGIENKSRAASAEIPLVADELLDGGLQVIDVSQ